MKRLLTFIILLLFSFIGFIHNSMMIFAMHEVSDSKIEVNNSGLNNNEENNNKDCIEHCCIEPTINYWFSTINNNINKGKLKIKNIDQNLDIFAFSLKSLEIKSLVKETSPPYVSRNIKNYTYHTLTGIIINIV